MIKYGVSTPIEEDSMKKLITPTLSVLLLLAAPFAFACQYPDKPSVPPGATASKDDMIAASRAVKAYQAKMIEYRECIDSEGKEQIAQLAEPAEDEANNLRANINKKYNASIEEEELIVARFNEAVRDYKAKAQ